MRYHEILLASFLIMLFAFVLVEVVPRRLGFQEIDPMPRVILIITILLIGHIALLIWLLKESQQKKQ